MMLKTISIAAAASAFIALTAPANAYDLDQTVHAQTSVNVADLDIRHKADAAVLLKRITSAAKRLCRPALHADHPRLRRFHACVDDAVERAVVKAGSPVLTELHGGNDRASLAQNQ